MRFRISFLLSIRVTFGISDGRNWDSKALSMQVFTSGVSWPLIVRGEVFDNENMRLVFSSVRDPFLL